MIDGMTKEQELDATLAQIHGTERAIERCEAGDVSAWEYCCDDAQTHVRHLRRSLAHNRRRVRELTSGGDPAA